MLSVRSRDFLLKEQITWTPHVDYGTYEYAGRLQFDGLLQGIVATDDRRKRMIEAVREVARPQRDCRPLTQRPFHLAGTVLKRVA
jgi:hypothetical protein